MLSGRKVVRHYGKGAILGHRLSAEQGERTRVEHHHTVSGKLLCNPARDNELVLILLGMPRSERLLERCGIQQFGPTTDSPEHTAPLQHIKITAHRLGRDSQLFTDLRHGGASAVVLDQQIGNRPLPLGRVHRHGCLSGTFLTRMTECSSD